jgi:hypothetical protein
MPRVYARLFAASSVLAIFSVLLPCSALAQNCVSSVATGINAGTLTLHGSDPSLASAVQSASSAWSGCSSTGLPSISLGSGGNLDYDVQITAVSSGPACGVTDVNSHTIYISQSYTYQGHHYPCDVNTTLEHEVGHVFGLADSPCGSGYLMGQQTLGRSDTRTLQAAECAEADRNVRTPTEHPVVGGPGVDPCSPQAIVAFDAGGDPDNVLPCGSPLILDMNGDGINTTSTARPVPFDFLGNGKPVETSWTSPTTEEAFLTLDLNRNGNVDGGPELFGTNTLLPSGKRANSGFEALAVYDSPSYGGDGDGRITPSDRIWGLLELWTDRNHNGISELRERRPLWSTDVQSLDLRFVETQNVDASGDWHRFVGTYSRSCKPWTVSCTRTGLLEDVFFVFLR